MLEFIAQDPPQPTVPNNQDVPKEMDIFFRNEADFLPAGKTFADLTPEELTVLKDQYKFSPFRPGIYQAVTGVKNSI